MNAMCVRVLRRVSAFLYEERGALTVEFVLWVPLITALLLIVVDTTTLYITQTEMQSVARETARRMTTGDITSKAAAESYAAGAMSLRDYAYAVDATYDPDSMMEVTIAVNFADISVVGYGPLTIFGGDLTARVAMRSPPFVLASAQGSSGGAGGAGTGGPPTQ